MKCLFIIFFLILSCSNNEDPRSAEYDSYVKVINDNLDSEGETKLKTIKVGEDGLLFSYKDEFTLETVDKLIYFIWSYGKKPSNKKIVDASLAKIICDLSLNGTSVKVLERTLLDMTGSFAIYDYDRSNIRNLTDVLLFRSRPEFICNGKDLSKSLLNNMDYYNKFFDIKLLNKKVGNVTFLSVVDEQCANPKKYYKTKESLLLNREFCTRGRDILINTLGAK